MKLFVILISMIMLLILLSITTKYEHWQPYIQKPLNYIYTGSSPLSFYRKDRYRKPYRYDFQFYQSYPYPHLSYEP